MSRRRAAVKRDVLPDSRYSDKVVTKVINSIMLDGKKAIAEGIFYSAMDLIKEKTGQEGYDVFKQALENIKPQIEVPTMQENRLAQTRELLQHLVLPNGRRQTTADQMDRQHRKRNPHGNRLALRWVRWQIPKIR